MGIAKTTEEMAERLSKPFPQGDLEYRIGEMRKDGTSATVFVYITARALRERLNEVCGPFNWQTHIYVPQPGTYICELSIRDPETKEWITKTDGADGSNMEAVKGGLSDAQKRAGYSWGIGEYLYEADRVWMPVVTMENATPTQKISPDWKYFQSKAGAGYFRIPSTKQLGLAQKVENQEEKGQADSKKAEDKKPEAGKKEDNQMKYPLWNGKPIKNNGELLMALTTEKGVDNKELISAAKQKIRDGMPLQGIIDDLDKMIMDKAYIKTGAVLRQN